MAAFELSRLLGTVVPSSTQPGVSYRLERQVGRGAMGVAFYALRLSLQGESPVVLKITRPDFLAATGDAAALMIQKEAVSLGRLNERVPATPYVVRLVDSGVIALESYGRALAAPWNAVEYIHGGAEGVTLFERVRGTVKATGAAFDARRAALAFRCIASGLRAIHEVGVIHRDLSTNNVLCCGHGDTELFKIADFGIARPAGVKETFGDVSLGTPGFAAPEQLLPDLGATGTWSDVFSLAGVLYFVLTGENYFTARTPIDALLEARQDARRTLIGVATLCQELRSRPEACDAIDRALARATATTVAARPATVDAFAGEVGPWLDPEPEPPGSRVVSTVPISRMANRSLRWAVRRQKSDLVVRSVAWDSDARCLAVTVDGLVYWDGVAWVRAESSIEGGRLSFAERVGPGQWLVGGAGVLATYGAAGLKEIVRSRPTDTVLAASGHPSDLALVVSTRDDGSPVVQLAAAGRWFRPLDLPGVASITALCRVADASFLLCTRDAAGAGHVNRVAPLEGVITELTSSPTRAFTAAAGDAEIASGIAVGAGGVVVRVDGALHTAEVIPGAPDLSATAIDAFRQRWAATAGAIFEHDESFGWRLAWSDPSWTTPFVSLYAQEGLVLAVTAEGAVLEGRAT